MSTGYRSAAQPARDPARFHWLDQARALAIALIVLGHFNYFVPPVAGFELIYAFHVPAFLIFTGFLLPADFAALGADRLARKWLLRYAASYAFFSLVAIALWWALDSWKAQTVIDPLPALAGAAYGVAGPDNWLVHPDMPLWYLPFLVSSLAAYWLTCRLAQRTAAAAGHLALLVLAAFSWFYHGPRLPWAVDLAGMGAVLIMLGQFARRHYAALRPLLERRRALLPALAGAAVLVLGSHLNGPVSINGAAFGANPLLFLIDAGAGTAMLVALASLLPQGAALRLVSDHTLPIFCLHILAMPVVALLPAPGGAVLHQIWLYAWTGVLIALCILASIALRRILRHPRWL